MLIETLSRVYTEVICTRLGRRYQAVLINLTASGVGKAPSMAATERVGIIACSPTKGLTTVAFSSARVAVLCFRQRRTGRGVRGVRLIPLASDSKLHRTVNLRRTRPDTRPISVANVGQGH